MSPLTCNDDLITNASDYNNPPIVKPFWQTYLAKRGEGGGGCHLSLNFNYCLSDLLLVVDLQTHHSSIRIQINSC